MGDHRTNSKEEKDFGTTCACSPGTKDYFFLYNGEYKHEKAKIGIFCQNTPLKTIFNISTYKKCGNVKNKKKCS